VRFHDYSRGTGSISIPRHTRPVGQSRHQYCIGIRLTALKYVCFPPNVQSICPACRRKSVVIDHDSIVTVNVQRAKGFILSWKCVAGYQRDLRLTRGTRSGRSLLPSSTSHTLRTLRRGVLLCVTKSCGPTSGRTRSIGPCETACRRRLPLAPGPSVSSDRRNRETRPGPCPNYMGLRRIGGGVTVGGNCPARPRSRSSQSDKLLAPVCRRPARPSHARFHQDSSSPSHLPRCSGRICQPACSVMGDGQAVDLINRLVRRGGGVGLGRRFRHLRATRRVEMTDLIFDQRGLGSVSTCSAGPTS